MKIQDYRLQLLLSIQEWKPGAVQRAARDDEDARGVDGDAAAHDGGDQVLGGGQGGGGGGHQPPGRHLRGRLVLWRTGDCSFLLHHFLYFFSPQP